MPVHTLVSHEVLVEVCAYCCENGRAMKSWYGWLRALSVRATTQAVPAYRICARTVEYVLSGSIRVTQLSVRVPTVEYVDFHSIVAHAHAPSLTVRAHAPSHAAHARSERTRGWCMSTREKARGKDLIFV